MASGSEEDLCCPVCTDIFKDPVVLTCSHSLCKGCLQRWWQHKPTRECPVCKTISAKKNPPVSLVLKSLCEALVLERDQRASESICILHTEKLKLFCLDHQEPVCLVCRDSDTHAKHRFRPIDEATREPRKKLQDMLQALEKKCGGFEKAKAKCDAAAAHIKVQTRDTERQIRNNFQKLHEFLSTEEEARISALRKEEEQKTQQLKKEIKSLTVKIKSLMDTVKETQAELKATDLNFLKNYKAAVDRVERALQRPPLEAPQMPKGSLINVAKHVGNLRLYIWSKMRDLVSYAPVVLDPNTACFRFTVSEDLSALRPAALHEVPENPERFDFSILGSEGFTSGIHSWAVDIGGNKTWLLGVFAESGQRRRDIQTGFSGIMAHKGAFRACVLTTPHTPLPLQSEYKKIQVTLDLTRGELSFLDLDKNAHIHTITHTFTGQVFPLFSVEGELQLLEQKISVIRYPLS
ncbi:E3 ubiquitin-protein ligase TRIM35-like [Cheilinus undulatus]|uniref:E3 ubiquitin-protein ligase TRIM35-like n=1 Tax=Cheilinus undulatus TaxID=241271 RepID=UPI001BD23D11|nr:E3 ubiquitin-protein ligase TRIM35-like [Cheilinus undulatus]